MSYMSKFVAALVGLLVMAVVASRQLFLFAAFRDPTGFLDLPGGRYHLWLAVSAGVTAAIAGVLMVHFFQRHEMKKWSKISIAPIGPALPGISDNLSLNSPVPARFDAVRWALANLWLSEGQPDDRSPMNGSVTDSSGTPSAHRAFARRSHQLMFKKWSQARHD